MIRQGTICYLTFDGKTLMIEKVKREDDPNSGLIVAPGGRVRVGENIYESVAREFREESGLEIIEPELRGTVLYDNQGRSFENFGGEDFFVYVFRAEKYRGSLVSSSREGVPKWVENNKRDSVNPRDCDRRLWDLVSGKSKFHVTFKHKGEVLDMDYSRIVLLENGV